MPHKLLIRLVDAEYAITRLNVGSAGSVLKVLQIH
ncbi:hypothetical protein ACVIVC_004191 [Sinorhizobium meliloti]